MFQSFLSSIAIPVLINIVCAIVYDAYKKSPSRVIKPDEEENRYDRRFVHLSQIQAVLCLAFGIVLLLCAFNSPKESYISGILYTFSFLCFLFSFFGTVCLAEAANYLLDKTEQNPSQECKK